MATNMRIGFAGMGIMGAPMAMHLLQAGYPLTVFNRSQEKCEPLVAKGAKKAASFEQLLGSSDVVICMLADAAALIQCLEQVTGEVEAQGIINMGTIGPGESSAVRERVTSLGLHYLEAPVAGSKPAAEAGQLVVLGSGETEWFERVAPVLSCFSKQVFYCGSGNLACVLKLSLNSLLASMTVALCESLALCEQSGVAPNDFFDVLAVTALNAPLYDIKRPLIQNRNYPVQFPLMHMLKDLNLARELLELPLLSASHQQYSQAALQRNEQDYDMSVVREMLP